MKLHLRLALIGFVALLAIAGAGTVNAARSDDQGFLSASVNEAPVEDACGNEIVDAPGSGFFFDFMEACAIHDACYAEGGSEFDRANCDNDFYLNMLDSCSQSQRITTTSISSGNLMQRIFEAKCRALALSYAAAVRIGGWAFFNYHHEEESDPI